MDWLFRRLGAPCHASGAPVVESWLAWRCGWSPFTGMALTGRPVGTVLAGRRVMWEAELLGAAAGRPLRFQETG